MTVASIPRASEMGTQRMNETIWRRTEENLARCAVGGKEVIDRRLQELDVEKDLESVLARNAAFVMLGGAVLGFIGGRRWLVVSAAAAGMLLRYVRTRQSFPPSEMLRRMGYRTRKEIEFERFGLKAMRGDFENVAKAGEDYCQGVHSVIEAEKK